MRSYLYWLYKLVLEHL